ncbi:MAG: hypothetical protein QOI21_3986 [Actinomycetota bacterium]|jgi:hypothetical protein|nr:hypothetical protein [Actinomycetota bacterium]
MNRGPATVLTVVASVAFLFPSQADVNSPDGGPTADVALKMLRDGSLSVTETVNVPGGQQLVRRIPLRVAAGEDQDRLYTIRDAKVAGPGKAEQDGDQLVLTLSGGESVATYTVDGAVADLSGNQQVRWQLASGWDAELTKVTASFVAPAPETSSVDCFAGPLGSGRQCSLSELDHSGIVRVEQDGLNAGERIDLAVRLPPGTVPANARFEQVKTVANAFSLTPLTGIGFAALALFLIAGVLAVWWLRRRDVRALSAGSEPVDMLLRDADRVYFASPDGVLPGQVGRVVDETVDVVDITATVVDLAVRNYLWIAEVRDGTGVVDWQLSRRNPADEHLLDFERAIFGLLLASGTDSVLLSELRGRQSPDLRAVIDEMYQDVVRKRWFTHRPDSGRNRLTRLGVGLLVLGLVSTVVLTFTAGSALLGVALAVAGVALTVGAGRVPSRTARGRALVGQVRGLLNYLHTVEVTDIPAPDREMMFSRSLPYAVVLGETERWLETFAGFDPSLDGSAGLYWFGGLEGERDLRRFAAHLPSFLTALDGLLAESWHLRSIRPEPVPA